MSTEVEGQVSEHQEKGRGADLVDLSGVAAVEGDGERSVEAGRGSNEGDGDTHGDSWVDNERA